MIFIIKTIYTRISRRPASAREIHDSILPDCRIILCGQQILDSMHSRFLNTPGSLAVKLMAALQGAKVIGADSRCASWNTSSKSAFIRIARPGDTTGTLFVNLRVLNTPFGRDPIDSLQVLFNNIMTPGDLTHQK